MIDVCIIRYYVDGDYYKIFYLYEWYIDKKYLS